MFNVGGQHPNAKGSYPPLFRVLLERVKSEPKSVVMIFNDRKYTLAELLNSANVVAKYLIALGVKPGNRVATLSPPRPEFVITYLAATSIGAVWQGLNPKYTERELKYVIADAKPQVIFTAQQTAQTFESILESIAAETAEENGIPRAPVVTLSEDCLNLSEHASNVTDATLDQYRSAVEEPDPAILVYTSGTTGHPKGALVRHSGISRLAQVQSKEWDVEKPVVIVNQPINHIGCVGDLTSVTLHANGTLVLADTFDPAGTVNLIDRHDVNALFQIPAQLQMISSTESFEESNLSSLKMVGWGGGTLPEQVIDRFRSKGLRVQNTYGLTEVTSSVSYSPPTATNTQLNTTVGVPDPDLQIRFLKHISREPGNFDEEWADPKGPGEVCVKHPTLMAGYLNRPQATAEAFTRDGWLRTGDIGHINEDGLLVLVGREKEMYKSGGYNIYPREIESVLEAIPGVELAAVVPRPDSKWGEVGVAFVQTNTHITVDDILSVAKDNLANFKVPKNINVVDELPRLPNHKIDKVKLKECAQAALSKHGGSNV